MSTYTLHIPFNADDDAAAIRTAATLVRKMTGGTLVNGLPWDVSSTDATGAQDWSVIVPRGTSDDQ